MRTVVSTEEVEIKVTKNDLIEGRWIPYFCLSNKIKDIENEKDLLYKKLRVRLYNSCSGNKYNMETKAGMKCIDIEKPMKVENASLILSFKKV